MINILKHISRFIVSVKRAYHEYEKSMSDLSVILGADAKKNDNINNLVDWFRKEYYKRPERYPGDHLIINMVKEQCELGVELNTAIYEAKKQVMRRLYNTTTF